MSRRALPTVLALLAAAGVPVEAATTIEELHYRWRIEGLTGVVARLLPMLPATGEAVLRVERLDGGRTLYLFRATSEGAPESHWTYTAELDPATGTTARVVDRLVFRGRDKQRVHEIEGAGAVDLLTALHQLRADPPVTEQPRTLWSDEKLYPVVIQPRGLVSRATAGRPSPLRAYTIRPARGGDGEGARFQGEASIWIEPEAPHAPAEIVFRRSFGRVRLRRVDLR